MANDFSGDSRIKALWRLEDGALTTDSKGTNTLTNNNVSADTSDKREGGACGNFVRTNSASLVITDANLDAGFPLKSGDTSKKGTIVFWFKPTTVPGSGTYQHIITKGWNYSGSKISFCIYEEASRLKIGWAYGTSGQGAYYYQTNVLTAGRWYHVAVIFDGVAKLLRVILYDNTAGTTDYFEFYPSSELRVVDEPFYLGQEVSGNYFDGRLDEVVVVNDSLSVPEINQIRAGTFTGAGAIAVSQLALDVEYTIDPEIRVTQLALQVEYIPPDPNSHVYVGNIGLSVTPEGTYSPEWAKTGDVPVAVTPQGEYLYQPPGEFVYVGEVGISVSPSSDSALGRVYQSPGIPITVTPQADTLYPIHFYESQGIPVEVIPAAGYRHPVTGFDNLSGYGAVDLAWLSENPPFWVPTSDIQMAFGLAAPEYALYAEIKHTAAGGVIITGDPVHSVQRPPAVAKIGEGGVLVGGEAVVKITQPKTISLTAEGGVRVGGLPILKIITGPAAIPTHTHAGEGGVIIGGAPVFAIKRPRTISLVAQGGVRVGGLFYPGVVVTRPADVPELDRTKISVSGKGGVEVSGASQITVTRPSTLTIPITPVAVVVAGECGLVIMRPQTIEILGDGGLIVGAESLPERCDTWVLCDTRQEPSLYTGFNFNSYAVHQGEGYAAAEDGIYLLKGEDDAGRPIRPGIRIGKTNFGMDGPKRLRSIYLNEGNEDAEVRVETAGRSGFFEHGRGGWKISRDLKGSEFVIGIADFKEVSHFEAVPLVLAKR